MATLRVSGLTPDNVILEGSLADCRQLAFACGMEVERYEGRILASDGGHAIYAPADASSFAICWLRGGMIIKARDGFCLVMPLQVWRENQDMLTGALKIKG